MLLYSRRRITKGSRIGIEILRPGCKARATSFLSSENILYENEAALYKPLQIPIHPICKLYTMLFTCHYFPLVFSCCFVSEVKACWRLVLLPSMPMTLSSSSAQDLIFFLFWFITVNCLLSLCLQYSPAYIVGIQKILVEYSRAVKSLNYWVINAWVCILAVWPGPVSISKPL